MDMALNMSKLGSIADLTRGLLVARGLAAWCWLSASLSARLSSASCLLLLRRCNSLCCQSTSLAACVRRSHLGAACCSALCAGCRGCSLLGGDLCSLVKLLRASALSCCGSSALLPGLVHHRLDKPQDGQQVPRRRHALQHSVWPSTR